MILTKTEINDMVASLKEQDGREDMTICIAALYDNCSGCVMASDQMTTAHFPIAYEFESDEVEKIVHVGDFTYVLIAGDVLFANEIIKATRRQYGDRNIEAMDALVEAARQSYQTVRKQHLIQTELEARGLDLNSYYQGQQKLLPGLVQTIDLAFRTYNPGVDLIIAGKDNSGCHIYTIQNPGESRCHDPIGFAAIGTGGPHAIYSLIEGKYKKSLSREKADELVRKAKERSEVAPGVGKGTTIESI